MSIRLRLFGDVTDSPGATTTDIESILTPESKGDNSVLGNDTPSFFNTSSKLTFETKSDARRNLFAVKRLAEDDFPNDTSCLKKNVISAVERLESRVLVADGSRDYILPTVKGKHGDLRSISPETLAEILEGKYMDEVGKVTIVDCRYPYEFDGGHIRGAINLYTKDDVNSLLYSCDHQSIKPHILIFHCEFSSERGP